MLRTAFLILLFAVAAFGQAQNAVPADVLQALVTEVHQLRLDLQLTTITSQRVQILLYQMKIQQIATTRASTRADEVRGKLSDAQKQRSQAQASLQQIQEGINSTTDPDKVKVLRLEAADLKREAEVWFVDERRWEAKDAEAQSQLRTEQGKLSELQETLDRLDKALASLVKQLQ